jgi:hypothetical protein
LISSGTSEISFPPAEFCSVRAPRTRQDKPVPRRLPDCWGNFKMSGAAPNRYERRSIYDDSDLCMTFKRKTTDG